MVKLTVKEFWKALEMMWKCECDDSDNDDVANGLQRPPPKKRWYPLTRLDGATIQNTILMLSTFLGLGSRESAVGITTGYRLDDQGVGVKSQ
jgi:hypothetical protein